MQISLNFLRVWVPKRVAEILRLASEQTKVSHDPGCANVLIRIHTDEQFKQGLKLIGDVGRIGFGQSGNADDLPRDLKAAGNTAARSVVLRPEIQARIDRILDQ